MLSQEGFAFRIYVHDHEPAHVHVWKAGAVPKVAIGDTDRPPYPVDPGVMKTPDVRRAIRIMETQQAYCLINGGGIMGRTWTPAADEELDTQIEAARERGRIADETEPRAKSARYNRRTGRIEIELRDGCLFAFPAEIAQGLHGATPKQLAAVKVEGNGYALRWEELDADFTVPGLIAGRFGTRRWMSELGRSGGQRTSAAKAAASRANGRKGGRPRRRALRSSRVPRPTDET